MFNALFQDLKFAVRQLRLNPGFALTAVASLALGIGANTAIFTLADQILYRYLPVEKSRELVQFRLEGGRFGRQAGDGLHTFSHPAFLALRDRNTVFSGLATTPDLRVLLFAAGLTLLTTLLFGLLAGLAGFTRSGSSQPEGVGGRDHGHSLSDPVPQGLRRISGRVVDPPSDRRGPVCEDSG